MSTRPRETYNNMADVQTEAYNLRREDSYEVVVRLRRGALRIGPAAYWLADGSQHHVSIVGFTIRNMHHRNDWPKERANGVKVLLDDAPNPALGPGRYIGQDDSTSPVIIPSSDVAVRGEGGRESTEAVARWLRGCTHASVDVVRVDDTGTDDPGLMEWGLALTRGADRPLILALKSIGWMD